MITLFTDEKGQSMTEFVMVVPVYLIMIFGVIFFVKAFFIKQQTISAARYVTIAKGEFKEDDATVKENLGKIFFNRLDKENVNFKEVKSSEALDTVFNDASNKEDNTDNSGSSGSGGSSGGISNEGIKTLLGALDEVSSTKGYEVSYDIEVKNKFTQRVIGNKSKVTIATTYYIDKNTWSHKDYSNLIDFLWEIIKNLGGDLKGVFKKS